MKKTLKGFTTHHIIYGKDRAERNTETTIPIRNKEHYLTTLLQRYKYVSYGFMLAVLWELFRLLIIKLSDKLVSDAKQLDK